MEPFEKLTTQLEEQLIFISQETSSLTKQAELSVPICITALEQLKKLMHKNLFKESKDEISFFKYVKPKIYARLIYHVQVFNIETRKPTGSDHQKKYFDRQLRTINRYMEENIEFYQYYRSESISLDEKYFIRGKADLHLILDNNFFNFDKAFNTSHDHVVAQILANDMLNLYIHTEISKIEKFTDAFAGIPNAKKLTWTENKVALIELMYALHSANSFNSGNIELSEIAAVFEKAFNVELKDYYRKYIEIKSRKGQQLKFIEQLSAALQNRINVEMQ